MFYRKEARIEELEVKLQSAEILVASYKRKQQDYDLDPRQKWLAHQALDYVCGWLRDAAAETSVRDGSGVAAVNELTSLAAECSKATEPLWRALGGVNAALHDNPFVKHLDN